MGKEGKKDKDKHKNKKQKRDSAVADAEPTSSEPAAGAAPAPGDDEDAPVPRRWTLSIAVPGTLLDAPPSLEFAVAAAAQIARAAAAFQVDEVVVYDDSPAATALQPGQPLTSASVSPGTALLARVLQFLETPPHLRPNLYPAEAMAESPELRLAAELPQVAPPHHARPSGAGVWLPYREGVVLRSEPGAGCYADVGLDRMVWLEQELPQCTRVTLHLGDSEPSTRFMPAFSETMIVGKVVPPSEPRERLGLYWGHAVRLALGLQRVFREAAVSRTGGYDLTIGSSPSGAPTDPGSLVLPTFRHALVVFGGGGGGTGAAGGAGRAKPGDRAAQAHAAGGKPLPPSHDLEQLVAAVPDWEHKSPQDVFNLYLNTTPHLGTLRLRTEDAVPIGLSYLISPLCKYGKQ
ncbi:hypothetical protein HYH03_012675 [Edaphochlamys debaryana]|uniref:Uncharacterized protein n=1 Tax=Edaphochlamys debaryana TaxID=47281 RepID=A0A835XRR0_9CHLO|nr:hypothetical protein HYH03_012675 [Edaphochlamys debaryana]|eukprot:KAG2488881.1 hypothetical protein HYH03_012675 [Edaphochlamys debaryana]